MTEPFEPPQLEPTGGPQIARIGGRRSAVIGTVAVIGVLIAVIWVGISGRSAPVAPPPNPAVAVLPSAAPTAGEPTARPTPFTLGEPDGPTALVAGDVFGAFATFGYNRYITILTESEPDHLIGRIAIPLPIDQNDGTFSFQQFSAPQARGRPVKIATWPINVESVAADSPLVVVVDESMAARRTLLNAPRPLLRGFHLTVTAQRDGIAGELAIDILIGPNQRILGDDGIFGWPTLANIRPAVDRPIVVTYDRTRGRYNYCRWDLAPLSAPPRPGTDEAAC
jgi:hypothetical protein